MKKAFSIITIYIALILSISGCSVYIPRAMPEEGIWYCEELKMSIDFSLIAKSEPDCVKQYADDGTYTILRCYVDYDDSMYICTPNQETWYYYGEFKYKGDAFIYTTDEDSYYFVRLENTGDDSDDI